jgi:hypothetical protein
MDRIATLTSPVLTEEDGAQLILHRPKSSNEPRPAVTSRGSMNFYEDWRMWSGKERAFVAAFFAVVAAAATAIAL